MPENTHIEMLEAVAEHAPQGPTPAAPNPEQLHHGAEELSRLLAWNPGVHNSGFFSARWRAMYAALKRTLDKAGRLPRTKDDPDDLRWLRDNMALLWADVWNTRNAFRLLKNLPHVRTPNGLTIPRCAAVAEAYLHAVQFNFSEETFSVYLTAFQKHTVLKFRELWALIPSMELVLLEQVAIRARKFLDN